MKKIRKSRGVSSKPAKPVLTEKTAGFIKDTSIPTSVSMYTVPYVHLLKWFSENEVEVSGLFSVNDDNEIKYITMYNRGTHGRVENNGQKEAVARFKMMDKGYPPNGQWHTHPGGMGAFWSSTDIGAQRSIINTCMPGSKYYFIVISSGEILLRVMVAGKDGKHRYNDGAVCLVGCDVPLPTKVSSGTDMGFYYGAGWEYGGYEYMLPSIPPAPRVDREAVTEEGNTRVFDLACSIADAVEGEGDSYESLYDHIREYAKNDHSVLGILDIADGLISGTAIESYNKFIEGLWKCIDSPASDEKNVERICLDFLDGKTDAAGAARVLKGVSDDTFEYAKAYLMTMNQQSWEEVEQWMR